MKLVVEYQVGGDYTFGPDCYTICCEYESAEKLYCDLETKLNDAHYRLMEHERDAQIWQDNCPENRFITVNKQWLETEDFAQYIKKNPQPVDTISYEKIFLGKDGEITFDVGHFLDGGQINMPEINELNEWFEKKKKSEL